MRVWGKIPLALAPSLLRQYEPRRSPWCQELPQGCEQPPRAQGIRHATESHANSPPPQLLAESASLLTNKLMSRKPPLDRSWQQLGALNLGTMRNTDSLTSGVKFLDSSICGPLL